MLVTKSGKKLDKKDRCKDRKAEHNKQLLSRVTATHLQKIKWQNKFFLITDSGSTEQQVLHIKKSQIPPKDSSAATQCTETF